MKILLSCLKKIVFAQGAIPATACERGLRRAAEAAADASTGQEAEQVRDPQALDQIHQTSAGGAEASHLDAHYSYSDITFVILAQVANGTRGETWEGRERRHSSAAELKSAKPSGRVAKMPLKEFNSHNSSHRRNFDGPCGFQSNRIV